MHVWSTWQLSTILEEPAAAMKLQLSQLPKSPLSGKSLCLAYVTFAIERNSWIRRGGMLIMHHKRHTHKHTICTLFLLPSPPPLSLGLTVSFPLSLSLPSWRIHHNCRRPTVLLLDDNMALRSMRYEYYQLARKCTSKIKTHTLTICYRPPFITWLPENT